MLTFAVLFLQAEELTLADREDRVDRILAEDHRQHAGIRPDDVAFGDGAAADAAVDRRGDVGVAEVDCRGSQIGLGPDHGALSILLCCNGAILLGHRRGAGLHQFLGPLHG